MAGVVASFGEGVGEFGQSVGDLCGEGEVVGVVWGCHGGRIRAFGVARKGVRGDAARWQEGGFIDFK